MDQLPTGSKIIPNPFYAINLHIALAQPHPTMVSKKEWVLSNLVLMKEIGAEKWLYELLNILEGDYV